MRHQASICAVVVTGVLLLGAAKRPQIVDSWISESRVRPYEKVIAVGITHDRETRHQFENKFVSHLRSRGIQAVTSYSLVPDLTAIEDREKILAAIEEQEIDGAISVRLVSLSDRTEQEWGAAWMESLGPGLTLRQVISETEPIGLEKAKRYGIEVAVWDARTGDPVWAGRTDTYKRKELRDAAGRFVTMLLNLLEDERVITR